MARIRTIKPEFWTDDALVECSPMARLLAIGSLNFADDSGNLERSAIRLKMQVLPADSVDAEELVQELLDAKYMIEYEIGGKKYLHIRTFKKHQRIDRPSKSNIPVPLSFDEDSTRAHGGLAEGSTTEGKGREGKGKELNQKHCSAPKRNHESKPAFVPPTLAEVEMFAAQIGSYVSPQDFIDKCQAVGWKNGQGLPIEDWRAQFRVWSRKERRPGDHSTLSTTPPAKFKPPADWAEKYPGHPDREPDSYSAIGAPVWIGYAPSRIPRWKEAQ